jgi:hypothetical protein
MNVKRKEELIKLAKTYIKYKSYDWNGLFNIADSLPVGEAYFLVRIAEALIRFCFTPKSKVEKQGKELSEEQKSFLKQLFANEIMFLMKEEELLQKIYEGVNIEINMLDRMLQRIMMNRSHEYHLQKNNLEDLVSGVNLFTQVVYKAITQTGIVDISYMQDKLHNQSYPAIKSAIESEIARLARELDEKNVNQI